MCLNDGPVEMAAPFGEQLRQLWEHAGTKIIIALSVCCAICIMTAFVGIFLLWKSNRDSQHPFEERPVNIEMQPSRLEMNQINQYNQPIHQKVQRVQIHYQGGCPAKAM